MAYWDIAPEDYREDEEYYTTREYYRELEDAYDALIPEEEEC